MVKIWAKLLIDGHIVKQFVYKNDNEFRYSELLNYIMDICHELDIPTPVLLKTHIFNFAKFRLVTFKANDFVESFPFDKFVIEDICG